MDGAGLKYAGSTNRLLLPDLVAWLRREHPVLARAWFDQLAEEPLSGGTFTIRTRNAAQAQYLRERCARAIAHGLQHLTGRLVAIRLEAEQAPADPAEPSVDTELAVHPDSGRSLGRTVVGPCNRLAHAAVVAAVNDPGRVYQTLFVHGPHGSGRSHLAHAAANALVERLGAGQVLLTDGARLTAAVTYAIEEGRSDELVRRAVGVSALVVDDVDALAGRTRSQEMFFHLFNQLQASAAQVIVTALSAPQQEPSWEPRIASRFSGGLVVGLEHPCEETRLAFLRRWSEDHAVQGQDGAWAALARREIGFAELATLVQRLDGLSQMSGRPIDAALVAELLRD